MRIASTKGRPIPQKVPKKKQKSKASKKAKPTTLWDGFQKGFEKVRLQAPMAASTSTSLRIGSRQLRDYLDAGITDTMGTAGMYVGLAAAGLYVAGAAKKLKQAVQQKSFKKGLDGVKNLGSASLIGLASVGKFALRRVVLPVTGGFNTFRGAFNFVAGWKDGDEARKALGLRTAISSLGTTARSLKRLSPWLLTAGRVIAPVAEALRAHKGAKTLAKGLRKNKNIWELKGLVDITSAVGLTMLLTGLSPMPGLAVFSTAQTLYNLYRISPHVRKVVDPVIDAGEPLGLKALDGIRNLKTGVKEAIADFKNPFVFQPNEPKDVDDSDKTQLDPWEIGLAAWPELEYTEPAVDDNLGENIIEDEAVVDDDDEIDDDAL